MSRRPNLSGPTRLIAAFCLLGSTESALADGPTPTSKPGPKLEYGRDIRPILSDKCFACHGPDEAKRKAKLRLDLAEAAHAAKAVVPGDPAASELLHRVASRDADEVMPPPDSGKRLSKDEIEKLRTWIEQGGSYARHWAFVPPVRPTPPEVKAASSSRGPIDRFILARLEREGLTPSPETDRATLLRRLSLDLIGLPPTPAEIDEFLRDGNPRAYERQVERLLNSPHYGERWARIWLDAARYADSDGYEKDKPREVWFYRDWVINALNRDMPYDRFIVEQLAGDLLPGATQDQIVATGFLRNSMINEEGGVDPEQFRMEAMFDRMDTVGKSVLGLTIQCAQCHSHKYDPLTQEEYYRMFAFLNNSDEGSVEAFTPEQAAARAKAASEIGRIEEGFKSSTSDWRGKLSEWRRRVKKNQPVWIPVAPLVDEISTGGQKYVPLPDKSLIAQGYAPTKHTVKLTVKSDLERVSALRLELLKDPNLPMGGPGRSIWGTAALSEIEVHAAPADDPAKSVRIRIAEASADLNPSEAPLDGQFADKSGKKRITGPVGFAVDGKDETAWTNDAGPIFRNQACNAVFRFDKPMSFPKGTVLTIHLKQNHGGWNSDDNQNCNLGRFRLSLTSAEKAVADTMPVAVRDFVDGDSDFDSLSEARRAEVFSYWRTTVSEWDAENRKIDEIRRSLPRGASQLVLHEKTENARVSHMLSRGDFLKPVASVQRGVPGFLNPPPTGSPLDRLGFARWIVDRQAPTTARAIANRVWQAYFGVGLVATPEDFGSQGEPPSHPELLDWLAVELMDGGWSLKALHRAIVTSRTYRQSSKVNKNLLAKDPYNRLLARGPRFRVDAETVRDVALVAGGLLDPTVGGPSVYPPAPAFLFTPPASYGPKIWREDRNMPKQRRSLYTFRYRSVPYPALQVFDSPNGDFSCVRRSRSNTPLQALTTLNEPVFLACARSLARLTVDSGGEPAAKLEFAFRRCLGRKPEAREAELLLSLHTKQIERFSLPDAKPLEVAVGEGAGDPTPSKRKEAAELAAWTIVSRVLLNLDETITKE